MANESFTPEGELPFSLEAEQAVLGSILLDPACLNTVSLLIKTEYFYLPQHREIYRHMLMLDTASGGTVDPLLLLNALKDEKIFTDETGKNYLYQLSKDVPTTANVEVYAKIVEEKYYVRSLILASREIIDSATNSGEKAETLLDFAEQKIYNIRQGSTSNGPVRLNEITPMVYERLYQITSPEREQYAGLKTGFEDLDRVTTGLNKSDLIIIGARPAMGKTSFALNLARNVAVRGKKRVVFFSLEMGKEQLAQRVLASEARVESTKMRTGRFTEEEWNKLAQATVFLSDFDLYFDDTSNITVPEMKSRIRRLKNVDCVIIDYLQLMKSAVRTDNRVQEVTEITRSLKLMAKDLNIPVITCAQLARGTEARGKSHKPQLADLRESGSIEQDADIVMMLYRENYYTDNDGDAPAMPNTAQVLVQKNRHGPTADIDLNWIPEYTLFTTKARESDDD
ncbi:MAG: replicative DNA helicase [Clostridia bacterium]|nr:replicative DNA helicase [Clostridia bacterium]